MSAILSTSRGCSIQQRSRIPFGSSSTRFASLALVQNSSITDRVQTSQTNLILNRGAALLAARGNRVFVWGGYADGVGDASFVPVYNEVCFSLLSY